MLNNNFKFNFLEGVSKMNNVCTENVNDLLVQFDELANEIHQIEEVATNPSAARTVCRIGGGGFN